MVEFERMKSNSNYVPDNYWQRVDYGASPTDAIQAYTHSMGVTERLRKKVALSSEKHNLKKLLVRDFDYFLKALKNAGSGYGEHAKELLNNLFYLDVFNDVPGLIKKYYFEIYCIPDNKFRCNLDFVDLYIAAGDKVLFDKHDVNLAMEYYKLAAWDWNVTANGSQEDTNAEKLKKYWQQQISFLQRARWIAIDEEFIEGFRYCYKELIVLVKPVIDIIRALGIFNNKVDYYKVSRLSDVFFDAYEKLSFNSETMQGLAVARMARVMLHSVIDMSLLYCLCAMKNLSLRTKNKLKEGVKYALAVYSGNDLKVLQRYYVENLQLQSVVDTITNSALVVYYCNELRRNLRYGRDRELAYYTTLDNLLYMTPAKCNEPAEYGCLSLMNISYMNDPNEGKLLISSLSEAETGNYSFPTRKDISVPYSFFKCFTTLVDYLPMWQMYGDKAKGICIVVDSPKLISSLGGDCIYSVCYLRKDSSGKYTAKEDDNDLICEVTNVGIQNINKCLDELRKLAGNFKSVFDKNYLRTLLGDVNYLFKDCSYAYEQEVRIIRSYDDVSSEFRHTNVVDGASKLFVKLENRLPVKEIIVGPKFKNMADKIPYLQEQLALMYQGTKLQMPEVTVSSIEYR